jgi:hypothetical protein
MNEVAADTMARAIPPFFFHYIIVVLVVIVILCVCVLKLKYFYWYEQPLTFRFTIRRFFRNRNGGGGGDRHPTSIMNILSLSERCYNAVVYPFLHHVNHDTVRVFRAAHDEDIPFERISQLLQARSKDEGIVHKNDGLIAVRSYDTLQLILSQETFGLSAFIGVFMNKDSANYDDIKGVSVLTPRIMISFDSSLTASAYRSVSIYMSEYLAWNQYTMTERESLELLETTEYIQKSREIAGEQTFYRYSEIPWFVIPFSTVYSYVFKTDSLTASAAHTTRLGHGMRVVRVSSANFALFYAFINEHTRDFRICILNELTQLQSLIEHGLYQIYMLLLNQTRVIAVYVFTQSSAGEVATHDALQSMKSVTETSRTKSRKKKTKGNRIADLHDYVSSTSTALVKYLPPVIPPKYDAFGKRIAATTTVEVTDSSSNIRKSRDMMTLRLISSIHDKRVCEIADFLCGFKYCIESTRAGLVTVTIDTIAHNHRIIDTLLTVSSTSFLSKDKWYYILYNAIIHEETLCKDILTI